MRYLGTKISENMIKDSVGQLICMNCIIARDGEQKYLRSELPGWDEKTMTDEVISINRPWEEVSKPDAIASFEAKPVVVYHPEEDVTTANYRSQSVVGYVKDVRPGDEKVEGHNVLLATLVIFDEDTIQAIESGRLRELSCGYDVDVDMEKRIQYDIVGNHVAIVDSGRGGITTIRDSDEALVEMVGEWPEEVPEMLRRDDLSVRAFNAAMRIVKSDKWNEFLQDLKKVPTGEMWLEAGYSRKWRSVGRKSFMELKEQLSPLLTTDAYRSIKDGYSGSDIRDLLSNYGLSDRTGDYTIEPDEEDEANENVILFVPMDRAKFDRLAHNLKGISSSISLYGMTEVSRYEIIAKNKEMQKRIMEHRGGVQDATPKRPRHSIITVPNNNVFHFDNVRELEKLLKRDDVTGIVEFSFEGEMVDDLDSLPSSYRKTLAKYGYETTETSMGDSAIEDKGALWKVIVHTTETNDPDEVGDELVLMFGPDDAENLRDSLEGLNFDEGEVLTLSGKEVKIEDLPPAIQSVLKKYLP